MNPWDNDPVDQPLKVEINGTAADVPPEPWNADPVDEQPDVRAGTLPAVDVDPEKAARARALSQATGIPASILEEDPAPAERRLKLEQLDAAAAADPSVASVLSDPETAKLAHDDVENLSLVSETVRSFGRFFGAIGAAIPQVNAGLWGVVRAGADIVGLDAAAAYAAERQGEQRGFVQDLRPQTGNWVLDAAYSGVTSAAQSALMAPAGAAGLLTGFGLTTGGDAYGQARDAGKGVGESLAFGASQGVIEAGTEMLPAGAFLRMMKGEAGGAVLKTIKEFAAKEAIGEQVATALQDLNEWAVLHPERPFSEYLAARPGAAAETLISTIVSVGASTTAAQALQAYGERAQRGVEAAKEAEQLLKASAASQLRARDPEAFRKFLAEASTGENGDESTFFIDGRAFAQAIGSTGVSFEEFRARAPELAQQMIDAVQTGGDVEIPVADFATAFAGTQEGATLLQHVRTSPDAASAAEAAVFAQTQPEVLQQEIERATAEAVGEEVGQRAETTVRDRILQQLQSTGRYNDEVASINAQVAASMFTALGAKMGRTAEQVMADFPLRIVGENPAAPGEVLRDGLDLGVGEPGYTEQRIDRLIGEFAYTSGRQKAMVAWVDPDAFLRVSTSTTEGMDRIREEAGPLDVDALTSETQTPFVWVGTDGAMIGHEGRHRLAALQAAGATRVPVVLFSSNTVEDFVGEVANPLPGQFRGRLPFKNPIPITFENRQRLLDEFSGTDKSLLFQRAPSSRVKNPTGAVRKLLKRLTPQEAAKITDATAAKIIDQLTKLPSADEMAAVAFAGGAKRGWYKNSSEALISVFGFDAPRFAVLLAAMSPQTSVENNLFNALHTWKNWVAAGRPTDRTAIVEVMGRSVQGDKGVDSVLDAWINNSVRALTAENPADAETTRILLSGPKVNSFFLNLIGVMDEVTNDAWMANYALVDQTIFAGSMNAKGTDPGKGTGYLAMSARVREAAARLTDLTGEEWTPAEVQETIWSWAKTLYELQTAEGETRGARQIVLDGGLTDDLINATPDFSSLFRVEPYASILKDAGYEQQLQDLAVADAAGQPAQGPGTGGQAAPFAEGDQRRLTLRAAQRLERLARERGVARQFTVDIGDRTAADVGGVVLNVGLADPKGGPPLTEEQVTKAIEGFGVRVVRSKRYQSDTEPTLVVRLSRELTPAEAHDLSAALGQEAIVQMVGYRGALHGPLKENWGAFNPDFFITLDGKRASQIAGATFAQSTPSPTVGYHFSSTPLTSVDGRYYGRAGAGEERARVARSDDPRIKSRVYAYVDWGNGIRPESMVGGLAHEIPLPALYDFDADPLRLRVPGDANATESAILDAGFGGYFVREFGNGQGAAVILGEASHDVPAKPATPPRNTRGPIGAPRPVPTRYRTPLMTKEIEAIDMADVQAAAPSAKLSAGTFTVDLTDLSAAREALAKFGVTLPEKSLEQPVYHGTPHEVDAFSFDYIGTGEGAQAFGWGLYFAEGRSTAAHYFTMLSGGGRPIKEIKLGHLTFGEHDSFDYTRRAHLGTRENVLASLAEQVMIDQREWDTKPPSEFQQYVLGTINYMLSINEGEHDVLEALRDLRRTLSKPGAVSVEFGKAEGGIYKLDIPDAAIERMLLWDAPLSEQPEAVKAALDPVIDSFRGVNLFGLPVQQPREATGEIVYKLLEQRFKSQTPGISDTEAARQASEYLASLGIPGNRYLDGVSRNRGDGTYNVVVWDQALLDEMNAQMEKEVAQRAEAPRGTFNPSTLTISLLEKADLSTFLHELGHFGLEMMVEIAAQPGAPQSVIDDVRIILDWFGVKDIQSWRAMTLDEQRPYHEQFAEGFETYLFEGKSPSAELNSAFSRIAAWMLNVYKSLTSMRVKLTPEVRGVFDRMLATNDQIAEQARLRNMAPLFSDPSQAGMSAKDWAAYQEVGAQAARDAVADLRTRTLRDMRWMANAKGRALKKLQDSAKEVRRGVRAEVEEQVDAQPVYAAMAFIERGTMADRDLTNAQRKALDTVAGGKTKLSLPALKALYGEGPAAPWRYIKQTLVAAEDGADPDAVAAAFGFDSGDALVRAILSAEPRQQLVEALTDKRMLEEHADLSDPVQIELAAEAAIHNEARIRFVATEMKALQEGMSAREQVGETKVRKGKNAGQTRAVTVDGLVRAATQYAEQIVGRTVVRRLSPTKHARAAANEAKAAAEAMKAGDLQTALAHKRNQLLHERTSRAMSEAITTFEKNLGYLRKFRRSNRARGAIDADYVEQIENLLNAIDTRNQTNKRLESINSLKKWIAAQEAEGLPVALDEELIESLQITNVRDLTVDQLQALVDQVKSIEHLGKLKKKLLTARDKREFDAIADELAATIREHGGKPREVPFAPGAHEHRFKRLWEGFFAEHRKLASLARQMDGVVDDGPMWRALIRGMNDAGNRETSLIAQSTKALADIFRPIAKMKGGLTGNKLLIPALGQSLSRGERMAVLLNWGNEHGRQRVLNTVPPAAVEQIMGTMSREEALAVQAVWDHINEYWPDIAAKEKRVVGTAPEKVDAAPFTMVLADGTAIEMRGGYYPLVYESEMSDVAANHEQAQVAKDMQAGAYTRATTRRGHTKKRAEKVGEPLRFTLDVIDRHISQVVHDLAWHEWLIDAGRLLRDKRISSAIRDHYGPATLKAMKDSLSDIATGDLQRMSRVEALAAGVRARTSAAVMGWSLTTALLQPFGIAQSIPRVGAVWIARGMKHWAGDALRLENSARLIREKSAMMRHRSTTFNRDIREVTARIHQGKGPVAEAFDASLFIAMQKLQLIADIPTWWGAYEKAMAEVDDEGRAVALADQAVLDAQGGGQVKDLAGVQRGNELKRALSMFYSYFSATWNMASESTARTNFRKPAQVVGWLADMVVLSVVPVLAQQVVFSLLRGGGGDDDKDWEERMLDLFKQLGAFWMNTLIGVREFSGMVQGFDYNGPAAARAIVEAGNVGKAAGKALDPDKELDDNDYRRVLKSVLTILGWPAAQVDRSWRGWKAWEEGEAGPGAILLGPPPKD